MNAEEKKGYEAAIQALRDILSGKKNNGGSSNAGLDSSSKNNKGDNKQNNKPTDPNGNPMQTPELNSEDKAKAAKNAQKGEKGKENNVGQAAEKHRKEAAEAGVSQGGMISQEAGSEIAKSEGYDPEDCKKVNQSTISNIWKEEAIAASSKNNGPGFGNIKTTFSKYWLTSHDWKSDLRKYVGKALSNVDSDTKIGKKKWLAHDVIKKYDKQGNNDLDNVVFMIDCSGSLSDKKLQAVISECYSICVRKGIKKVTYIYYDNGIRQIDTNDLKKFDGIIDSAMAKKMKGIKPDSTIHGRGGNDESKAMDDLLNLLNKNHRKLELLMWFTDGYVASIPKSPKSIKHTIWTIFDNPDFKTTDGSRVIHIDSADIGK